MQRYPIYVKITPCFYSDQEIKYLIKNGKQAIKVIIIAPTIQEISLIAWEEVINLYIFLNDADTKIIGRIAINF